MSTTETVLCTLSLPGLQAMAPPAAAKLSPLPITLYVV